MTEPNYTKGEWKLLRDTFNDGEKGDYPGYIGSIVAVDDSEYPWFIARIENAPEDEANARLIAAAPELYEALKLALPFIGLDKQTRILIEQVLSKVEGD